MGNKVPEDLTGRRPDGTEDEKNRKIANKKNRKFRSFLLELFSQKYNLNFNPRSGLTPSRHDFRAFARLSVSSIYDFRARVNPPKTQKAGKSDFFVH